MKPLISLANGETHLSLAGMLVMAARTAYHDCSGAQGAVIGRALVTAMLDAASAAGFKQRDICETALVRGPKDSAVELAQSACDLISSDAMRNAFMQGRITLTGDVP